MAFTGEGEGPLNSCSGAGSRRARRRRSGRAARHARPSGAWALPVGATTAGTAIDDSA